MLELADNDVAFLGFSESSQEHIEVVLHLLGCLGVDFTCDTFNIVDRSPSESFDELQIISLSPLAETLRRLVGIFLLHFIRNLLKVLL